MTDALVALFTGAGVPLARALQLYVPSAFALGMARRDYQRRGARLATGNVVCRLRAHRLCQPA